MLNSAGELLTAVSDKCVNYKPDKTKKTNCVSAYTGAIYLCHNRQYPDDLFFYTSGDANSCCWCENRQYNIEHCKDIEIRKQW